MPRWRRILLSCDFWGSIALAAIAAFAGEGVVAGAKSVDAVGAALLTYAAIAFGFCLAGLTLALTLPDPDFARQLARRQPRSGADSYSDLLFVFSWTAVWHWLLMISVLGLLAFTPPGLEVMPVAASGSHRAVFCCVVFITCYGISQFLTTVITLSQVGRVFIHHLKR